MSAAGATSLRAGSAFNFDAAVTKLLALASNWQSTQPQPREDAESVYRAGAFTLSRLNDWPEPSPAHLSAEKALQDFQDELVAIGGTQLPVDVWDSAVEAHGHRAVRGAGASWDGRHDWYC